MRKPRTLRQALIRYRINLWDAENPQVLNCFTGCIPQHEPRLVHLATEETRRCRAEEAARMVAKARTPHLARLLLFR